MTKQEFRDFCKNRIVYLDGATGSNMVKAGMPAGVCPEQWIIEHEGAIIDLQRRYVDAGSNIVYIPTFTANRIKLEEYGLQDNLVEMNRRLVEISRKAVGDKALCAADITMTGRQLRPIGDLDFEELVDVYKEQLDVLSKAGADLIVVETMMSLQETRAALIAAKETCDLPIIATLTMQEDGRTLFGTDAVTAAVVLASLGADAVGLNCSTGPAAMAEMIRQMAQNVEIPIIAKPNAGMPKLATDGSTYYDMNAEKFAEEMQCLYDAGASILGGCCGTDPEYIRAIFNRFGTERKVFIEHKPGMRYLCSERKTLTFGLDDPFMVIGERINPTGKKKLQAELKEGSMELVRAFAEEQEICGAKILDVNMGLGGVDEKALMLKAIDEVTQVTSLPLSLDSSYVEVLEAALRRYPGRALVNSVSCESEKIEKLLPIVKKYGAMFILLPLKEQLPANLEEKIDNINLILQKAYELGFCKEDIVVDGLVATVGANPRAALDCLETFRYCKKEGLATVCGLSNISFSMPERNFINSTFLAMSIEAGLTMAIANPGQEMLMGAAYAADLLLKKDGADMAYIEYAGLVKEKRELAEKASGVSVSTVSMADVKKGTTTIAEAGGDSVRDKLKEAVLKGNCSGIEAITQKAIREGEDPNLLLNQVLLPAINTVGDYFDSGKYFLPQLMKSAEAMELSIKVLEPLLVSETKAEDMPTVIIATVKGDIHDIGKNLVALMLKNYGFRVIDLGKDVPKERIIDAAIEHNASVIALSALMTTTMKQMEYVIEYAKERGVKAKIMVGGAVITEDYANEIGADGYSKDAADAVKLAGRLCSQFTVKEEK